MRIEQQANPSTSPVIVERWAEAVLRLVQRAKFLPLLREVEERAGERRCVFIGNSPLLNPLPARSSRGEEAKRSFGTISAPPSSLFRLRPD
jgi:hypothetical protein